MPTTFAFDKPQLSSSVFLASIALTLLGCSRLLLKDGARTATGQHYEALPLDDPCHVGGKPHSSRHPFPTREDFTHASSLRKLQILFLVLAGAIVARPNVLILIGAIVLRTNVLLHVLLNTQCTGLTWEPLLPFAFACWDYWNVHRHRTRRNSKNLDARKIDNLEHDVVRSRFKYLTTIGFVSIASLVAIATTRGLPSTYICAASQHSYWVTPFLQRLGTVFDILIVSSATRYLHEPNKKGATNVGPRLASVGWAFVFSFVINAVFCIASSTAVERRRFFVIPGYYIWSLFKFVFLLCVTTVCGVSAVSPGFSLSTTENWLLTFTNQDVSRWANDRIVNIDMWISMHFDDILCLGEHSGLSTNAKRPQPSRDLPAHLGVRSIFSYRILGIQKLRHGQTSIQKDTKLVLLGPTRHHIHSDGAMGFSEKQRHIPSYRHAHLQRTGRP